jgi:formylglycine-generating enzyme required for sulfatase activity
MAPPQEAGVFSDGRDGDAGSAEVARPDTTVADTTTGDLARVDTQAFDTQGLTTTRSDGGGLDVQAADTLRLDTDSLDTGADTGGDDLPAVASDAGDAFAPIEAGVDGVDPAACPGTGGPGMVRLPRGYCIDRTEVTRSQYETWLATNPTTAGQDPRCDWNTTFTPPGWCAMVACQGADCGAHPQACVDWCDAFAYCKAVGKRLCGARSGGPVEYGDGYADASQSQWYNACTSGGVHAFPYGDTYEKVRCNGSDSGLAMTAAAGSLAGCQSPAAFYDGVFDLSGNLAEWEDACDGATGAEDKCRLRGGSYDTYYLGMDCNQDYSVRRGLITQTQGIRCCSP